MLLHNHPACHVPMDSDFKYIASNIDSQLGMPSGGISGLGQYNELSKNIRYTGSR